MTKLGICIGALFCLAAGSATAQPGTLGFTPKDSHWIEDPVSHCWAANPNPEEGESISWAGGCENMLASGPGVLTWYRNGELSGRDEGEFKRGELSGHGKISFADGATFEGEFPGNGVLTAPDGRKVPAQSVKERTGWSIEQIAPGSTL